MKNLHYFFFLLLLGSATVLNAQNVNIPDSTFKAELVANTAINTNADMEIQVSEAAAFAGMINVNYKSIASLVGIEAFTALTTLWCSGNQLPNLDVSANGALTSLWCSENQLTDLDVSTNTALTSLMCGNNQLTTLNVKNGNNSNFGNAFDATGNPDLICIEVDSVAYSIANWVDKPATASYSTDCSTFNSTTTLAGETININTYPNPTNGNINISLGKSYDTTVVTVSNMMGQVVSVKEYNGVNQIDMNIEGAAGIYFVNVRTELGEVVVKLVKE